MTRQEAMSLSAKDAKEKLIELIESPYYDVYVATRMQLISLAGQIRDANINFSDEDKLFDAFIKWGEKVEKITDSLESIMKKMDKDQIKKAEEAIRSAREFSPEAFASKRG